MDAELEHVHVCQGEARLREECGHVGRAPDPRITDVGRAREDGHFHRPSECGPPVEDPELQAQAVGYRVVSDPDPRVQRNAKRSLVPRLDADAQTDRWCHCARSASAASPRAATSASALVDAANGFIATYSIS